MFLSFRFFICDACLTVLKQVLMMLFNDYAISENNILTTLIIV